MYCPTSHVESGPRYCRKLAGLLLSLAKLALILCKLSINFCNSLSVGIVLLIAKTHAGFTKICLSGIQPRQFLAKFYDCAGRYLCRLGNSFKPLLLHHLLGISRKLHLQCLFLCSYLGIFPGLCCGLPLGFFLCKRLFLCLFLRQKLIFLFNHGWSLGKLRSIILCFLFCDGQLTVKFIILIIAKTFTGIFQLRYLFDQALNLAFHRVFINRIQNRLLILSNLSLQICQLYICLVIFIIAKIKALAFQALQLAFQLLNILPKLINLFRRLLNFLPILIHKLYSRSIITICR